MHTRESQCQAVAMFTRYGLSLRQHLAAGHARTDGEYSPHYLRNHALLSLLIGCGLRRVEDACARSAPSKNLPFSSARPRLLLVAQDCRERTSAQVWHRSQFASSGNVACQHFNLLLQFYCCGKCAAMTAAVDQNRTISVPD